MYCRSWKLHGWGRKRDRVHMDLGFAFTGVGGGPRFQKLLFTGEFKNIRMGRERTRAPVVNFRHSAEISKTKKSPPAWVSMGGIGLTFYLF